MNLKMPKDIGDTEIEVPLNLKQTKSNEHTWYQRQLNGLSWFTLLPRVKIEAKAPRKGQKMNVGKFKK